MGWGGGLKSTGGRRAFLQVGFTGKGGHEGG